MALSREKVENLIRKLPIEIGEDPQRGGLIKVPNPIAEPWPSCNPAGDLLCPRNVTEVPGDPTCALVSGHQTAAVGRKATEPISESMAGYAPKS